MVPTPPAFVTPRRAALRAGEVLYRVHHKELKANEFHPGVGKEGRFHPIWDDNGRSIPTLYACDLCEGAFAETVFRDVVGGNRLLEAHLVDRCLSKLELRVDIDVADLTGHGLKVIGVKNRSHLLDCGESHYKETARWAETIHRSDSMLHGMIWISRQFDLAKALLAFGDRVSPDSFAKVEGPLPLNESEGFHRVYTAASRSGIDVVTG